MEIHFMRLRASARVTLTDVQDTDTGGWRHAEVSGTANDEASARAIAEEIEQILIGGRDTRWRVAFEYKLKTERGLSGSVPTWHLYARFSFRTGTVIGAARWG